MDRRLTSTSTSLLVAFLSASSSLAAPDPKPAASPASGGAAAARRAAGDGQAQGLHEAPPRLAVADVLPEALRKGGHYRVADPVVNDGFMDHFTIESDFGRFAAPGRSLLETRVREVAAIAQLDEVSKTKVFLESAAKAAVKPVESVVRLAEDPKGTVEGIPTGAARAFGRIKRKAGAAADKVGGDDEDGEGKEGAADTRTTGDKAAALAKSWLGISASHRQWAQKLGVDPYSANPVLAGKLDGVAKVDRAGAIGAGLAMPSLPAPVGHLARVSDLVWSKDSYELFELNQKRLEEMGAAKPLADRFLANRHFTPSKQTAVVSALHALTGTAARAAFLEPAVLAASEAEAAFYVDAAAMLAGHHAGIGRIERLEAGPALARARLPGGKVAVLAPVDRLGFGEEVDVLTRKAAADAHTAPDVLWVTGVVSERARKEIEARGIRVEQGARSRLGLDVKAAPATAAAR